MFTVYESKAAKRLGQADTLDEASAMADRNLKETGRHAKVFAADGSVVYYTGKERFTPRSKDVSHGRGFTSRSTTTLSQCRADMALRRFSFLD